MWLQDRKTRRSGALASNVPGFKFFDSDVFDASEISAEASAEASVGQRFRELPVGRTFSAGGRVWKIINTQMGHNVRLVQEKDAYVGRGGVLHEPDSHWAEVVGDEIVISALSKRSPARPVGKPVARTRSL